MSHRSSSRTGNRWHRGKRTRVLPRSLMFWNACYYGAGDWGNWLALNRTDVHQRRKGVGNRRLLRGTTCNESLMLSFLGQPSNFVSLVKSALFLGQSFGHLCLVVGKSL